MSWNSTDVNDTHAQFVEIPRTEMRAFLGVSLLLDISGGASILLLILTILSERNLRKRSGILILHLAFIEWSMCVLHFPLELAGLYQAQYYQRTSLDCNTVTFLQVLCYMPSHWTMLFIAINRLVALVFPHSYNTISSRKVTYTGIGLLWTVSIAVILPIYYGVGAAFGQEPTGKCSLNTVYSVPFIQFCDFLLFYGPLTAMMTIYFFLFVWIRARRRTVAAVEGDEVYNSQMKRRVKLTNMMFAMASCYFVAYLPGPILTNILHYQGTLFLWSTLVRLVSYCLNPVRISFLSHFILLIRQLLLASNPSPLTTLSNLID